MTTVVLIHGGESTGAKLRQAMPGANVVVIYEPGLSAAYNEVTGLASKHPTLNGLMATYAPAWRPGERLVMLGFSAGGWALRYYLRDPAARDSITAAIFLDATYGNVGSQCSLGPYEGVVAYGKEANASPSRKRLVMTYSQATPGPGICANAIEKAAGAGPGVFVRGYANGDHGAQQNTVGPQMVRELVAPWIGGLDMTRVMGLGLALVGLTVAGVIVWRR